MGLHISHMWIPRDIEPRLLRSARTRPVLVLTGARQTGKTSTFRRLFSEYEFVSLDLIVQEMSLRDLRKAQRPLSN